MRYAIVLNTKEVNINYYEYYYPICKKIKNMFKKHDKRFKYPKNIIANVIIQVTLLSFHLY